MKFDKNGKFIKTWGKKGMGPGEFDVVHTLAFDSRGRLFVGDRQNNRIQISIRMVSSSRSGSSSAAQVACTSTRGPTRSTWPTRNRGTARTNTGQLGLPQTGYAFNPGAQRGIRIGSARDGTVRSFIPDPCTYPYPGGSSLAEGVTIDAQGNVYGADFLGAVRKFAKK